MNSKLLLFWIFLRLGLTSFGGPVAHLGYFREEFVNRRRWFTEEEYADKVALCQLIPGPASSQTGLLIGYQREGYLGALLAWFGFTLPSALALGYLGITLANPEVSLSPLLLTLLKAIAIAVILQAVIGMARTFCITRAHQLLMLASASALTLAAASWLTPLLIIGAGLISLMSNKSALAPSKLDWRIDRSSMLWLFLFFAGLLVLPLVTTGSNSITQMFNSFFRAGALVMGGGHVVLPLLADATVTTGLISSEAFISGYGAAQAVPGPLFTFAAFLGGALDGTASSAAIATIAIFLPAVALLFGVFPIWERLKTDARVRLVISGANAAVVGVLLAALLTITIQTLTSLYVGLAVLVAFGLLQWFKIPAWILVAVTVVISLVEAWIV